MVHQLHSTETQPEKTTHTHTHTHMKICRYEDMHHPVKTCLWFAIPCAFCSAYSPRCAQLRDESLWVSDYLEFSLFELPGLHLWNTAWVLWAFRCLAAFRAEVPDMNIFLRILHSAPAQWLQMPDLSLSHQAVPLYM